MDSADSPLQLSLSNIEDTSSHDGDLKTLKQFRTDFKKNCIISYIKINSYRNMLDETNYPSWSVCDTYALNNLIKEQTYFHKGGSSSLDVLLTNQNRSFTNSETINTHLSDGHSLVYCVLKTLTPRKPGRQISYRSFKNLVENDLIKDLSEVGLPFHPTFSR